MLKNNALTETRKSREMSRIRTERTGPEESVALLLRKADVSFIQNVETLPGSPDIVTNSNVAIFVHGCFWHRHSCKKGQTRPKTNASFWYNKLEKNTKRDRRNARELRKLGYSVYVIWECKTRMERISSKLMRRIEQGQDKSR